MEEHIYIVAYDISDKKRWRTVFNILSGYGKWIQLSLFQCRLSKVGRSQLESRVREVVRVGQDHLLIIDVGPVSSVGLRIESIGRPFYRIEKRSIVI